MPNKNAKIARRTAHQGKVHDKAPKIVKMGIIHRHDGAIHGYTEKPIEYEEAIRLATGLVDSHEFFVEEAPA